MLIVLTSILFSGCVVSGPAIVAFTSGAVLVAENVGGVAKTYKDTKEYLFSDSNNTKKGR